MKISTIIPVYNCETYIEQTLEILRLQSFPKRDLEVIVFLDGCTDKTPEIVKKYQKNHSDLHLKIINSSQNVGSSKARNKAASVAVGKYIHFMDCDDLINEDFYTELYKSAENTNCDVAVASFYNEKYPKSSILFDNDIIIKSLQDKIDYTQVDKHGYAWRYLIKRSFWEENDFAFPEDVKYVEDLVLMSKLIYKCNYISLVPGAIYYYKYRANSMLNKNTDSERRDADYKKALSELNNFFTKSHINYSVNKLPVSYIRLFNILPLLSIIDFGNDKKVFLFNFIPLFKIRNKIKIQKYK